MQIQWDAGTLGRLAVQTIEIIEPKIRPFVGFTFAGALNRV